jgi:hypothetical protein
MRKILLATALALAPMAAHAVPQTTATLCGPADGNGCAFPDDVAVFLQAADGVTQGDGNIGSQTGLPLMHFVSLGGTLNMFIDLANGFATIKPSQPATTFNGLTISIPGFLFGDLV